MKSLVVLTVLTLISGVVITGGRAQQAMPALTNSSTPPKTAEQAFKSIQVLKGVPADQLIPAMQFISASLGVECEFCHVRDQFEKDEKKPKEMARKMIQMQMAINKESFEGRSQVTCYSCHRGAHDPVAIPIISDEDPKPAPAEAAAASPRPASPPPADPILDKYVRALGGADAIQKVSTRVEKGTLSMPRGQAPVEIFAKAPDKRIAVAHLPNGDSITAFDGHVGWLGSTAHPHDMSSQENAAARLDADFHFATDLKQIFNEFRVARPEKIGDRQTAQVLAIRRGQPPVRLYFDEQSGLLLRMVRYAETPLGRNPTQVDYADYRDSGGVKIPYRWTVARPSGRFTIQIDQVQQNMAIDDTKFAKPAAPAEAQPAK